VLKEAPLCSSYRKAASAADAQASVLPAFAWLRGCVDANRWGRNGGSPGPGGTPRTGTLVCTLVSARPYRSGAGHLACAAPRSDRRGVTPRGQAFVCCLSLVCSGRLYALAGSAALGGSLEARRALPLAALTSSALRFGSRPAHGSACGPRSRKGESRAACSTGASSPASAGRKGDSCAASGGSGGSGGSGACGPATAAWKGDSSRGGAGCSPDWREAETLGERRRAEAVRACCWCGGSKGKSPREGGPSRCCLARALWRCWAPTSSWRRWACRGVGTGRRSPAGGIDR
jgi:hypothetical protein